MAKEQGSSCSPSTLGGRAWSVTSPSPSPFMTLSVWKWLPGHCFLEEERTGNSATHVCQTTFRFTLSKQSFKRRKETNWGLHNRPRWEDLGFHGLLPLCTVTSQCGWCPGQNSTVPSVAW